MAICMALIAREYGSNVANLSMNSSSSSNKTGVPNYSALAPKIDYTMVVAMTISMMWIGIN